MIAPTAPKVGDLVPLRSAIFGTRASMGDLSKSRAQLSEFAKPLADLASRCSLSDPIRGFFVLDRRFLEEIVRYTSGVGFKILLGLAASSSQAVRLAEVSYRFRQTVHASSKLDSLVGVEYLQLLLGKFIGTAGGIVFHEDHFVFR